MAGDKVNTQRNDDLCNNICRDALILHIFNENIFYKKLLAIRARDRSQSKMQSQKTTCMPGHHLSHLVFLKVN